MDDLTPSEIINLEKLFAAICKKLSCDEVELNDEKSTSKSQFFNVYKAGERIGKYKMKLYQYHAYLNGNDDPTRILEGEFLNW